MNKAKAAFAAIVVVAVAGATALCYGLNKQGVFGAEQSTEDSSYEEIDDGNYDGGNDNGDYNDEKNTLTTTPSVSTTSDENNSPTTKKNTVDDINNIQLNKFLTNFSEVYFAEDSGNYSESSRSNYELIKFAFSHLRKYNNDKITTLQKDGDSMPYLGISYDDANQILTDFLGVSVSRESVYTEKNYLFFKYEDGYFYTPATDGIGSSNVIVADSVTRENNKYYIDFTIYSDGADCSMSSSQAKSSGTKYADGSATVISDGNSLKLLKYSLK